MASSRDAQLAVPHPPDMALLALPSLVVGSAEASAPEVDDWIPESLANRLLGFSARAAADPAPEPVG